MYRRSCSLWWHRAGKERRTTELSSQLFLAIVNILTLTTSGRQSPSACYLLKDHFNIYKCFFFFLVFAPSLANLWKAGWAPVKWEIRPLFTEQMVRCNKPYWAPFCCPSLLAVTARGVSTSICMPALSIRPGTNLVVFFFFNMFFKTFF